MDRLKELMKQEDRCPMTNRPNQAPGTVKMYRIALYCIASLGSSGCVNITVLTDGSPVIIKRSFGVVHVSAPPENRGFAYSLRGLGVFADHSELFIGYRDAQVATNIPDNSVVVFDSSPNPQIQHEK